MFVQDDAKLSSVLLLRGPGCVQSLTKIIVTLGPKSCSVEVIEACLRAGMSIARFDFSRMDADYHQETLVNLRKAVRNSRKLCAVFLQIMMNITGPELRVCNESDLAKMVRKGDTIFLTQHLFTGHETTSSLARGFRDKGQRRARLHVTIYASNVQSNMPALTESDKRVIEEQRTRNSVNFISLSYTRRVEDVRELRAFLKTQNLRDTQIYAKIETMEGLRHFNEILEEADRHHFLPRQPHAFQARKPVRNLPSTTASPSDSTDRVTALWSSRRLET